jgi:2-polyprenyl-6-methoxyphenol hydroxylase-like FAD-dependent oxidoreductase
MNYPATFLEREAVLRVLYENVKDKSKIRLEKKITKVDHNNEEVIVLCEDGTAVSGDILVGCDGVHSKVRQELWRVSDYQEPGAFDQKDRDMLFAEYNCLFGIFTKIEGIHSGDINVTNTRGTSTMVIGGKGKVLWFVFEKMDKVYHVPNIPRYTQQDAEDFGAARQDITVTPQVKFGEIWANITTRTLVATEEAQLKRWSWGRIACVGDSVHKMTPNMGNLLHEQNVHEIKTNLLCAFTRSWWKRGYRVRLCTAYLFELEVH